MKNKKQKKIKLNWRKIVKMLLIILAVIAVVFGVIKFKEIKNNIETRLTDSQTVLENKILEKDNKIEELKKQIEELKTKQNELENKNKELEQTIEQVKVSKAQQKITATTRGSSNSRTAQASTQPTTTNSNAQWIWANVSAYCSCPKCCGKYSSGFTASGTKATAGRTVAAPSNYKFGTKIELQGMGVYTVEDRGGAITGNKIDVYFSSHAEAIKFGRRQIKMRVV